MVKSPPKARSKTLTHFSQCIPLRKLHVVATKPNHLCSFAKSALPKTAKWDGSPGADCNAKAVLELAEAVAPVVLTAIQGLLSLDLGHSDEDIAITFNI